MRRAEFDDAFDGYEQRQPGLGIRFDAVCSRLDVIAADPLRFAVINLVIREVVAPGFPYCVYSMVKPPRILVLSVFHTSRNPVVWRRRNTP